MKKITFFLFLIIIFLSISFIIEGDKEITSYNNVVLQFMTTNLMSNNLYIDNILIGNSFDNDVAAVSIDNIGKDTVYSVYGNNSFSITPKVTFLNEGRLNVSVPFNVTLQINPGNYTSVKQVTSLNSKRAVQVTFDNISLNPNIQYTIRAWPSISNEQNYSNDTLSQNTFYLPGAPRYPLFESYTNTSCPDCTVNDPYLDTFVVSKFDSLVPISYHAWWPSPADPMYTQNTVQNRYRVNYYPINNVPVLNVDGVYLNICPFSIYSNLLIPFRTRLNIGSPLGLTVTDSRLAGDTIQANITLNIYSQIPSGNYRMRVNAVERYIHYANPPGSNGIKDFYDVFRWMYPDTNGISIPNSPGMYNYTVKYHRNSVWVDSMIYTAVYVQNDNTKEVLNAAKARHVTNYSLVFNESSKKQDYSNTVKYGNTTNYLDSSSSFYLEPFEVGLPPAGWTITNTDNVNFNLSYIANGPSFGGSKSVVILLMSSSGTTPSYHYLKSKTFNNINLDDSIKFDWAFARYGNETVEGLRVQVSTDGGTTFPYTIFNRVGVALSTIGTGTTGIAFVPRDSSQWGTFGYRFGDIIGIKPISTHIPNQYYLYQNYPNPFNPVTRIKFDIPSKAMGETILSVYDILGRKTAVLLNEKLNPGSYEIEWNAINYPSGVYFYKLSAGEYNRTNKMILIK